MGGMSDFNKNVYNKRCAEWVKGFLSSRCIVRPNRWEYTGDLYAAYMDYAKGKSDMGWNMSLTHNRFSRCVAQIFMNNNWFFERQATPSGHHRIIAGVCLKENSSKRSPDDLLKTQNKPAVREYKSLADTIRDMKELDRAATEHANPDSGATSSEPANIADRDALAKKLWEQG